MASFMAKYSGTDIIDLGDGWNVTIKRYLPGNVLEKAEAAKVKSTAEAQRGKDKSNTVRIETTQDMSSYTDVLLMEAIVAWNLTDLDESVMPLTPKTAKLESIQKLPAEVRTNLRERIEKEHAERTPDEQADFREQGEIGA